MKKIGTIILFIALCAYIFYSEKRNDELSQEYMNLYQKYMDCNSEEKATTFNADEQYQDIASVPLVQAKRDLTQRDNKY
jgi:uncharacterized protein YpmB|tara:strand:- start:164 stop:400 length:237 start_codon:yes stop_codon:yes gene_type:complete